MLSTINKVRQQSSLYLESGREATSEELASDLDMSVMKVEEISKMSQEPISLEAKAGEEGVRMVDLIVDENAPNPEGEASFHLLRDQILYLPLFYLHKVKTY